MRGEIPPREGTIQKLNGALAVTPQTFPVHLSAASPDTIKADWATANNTAGPNDFVVSSAR